MALFTDRCWTLEIRPSEPCEGARRLLRHKALIDEYLPGLAFSGDPRLANLVEAMRYSFLAGGERLRPVLCMEVAGSFGLAPQKVLPSAAAVELIHTLSLVHDGLPAVNGDESKGEKLACHEKFGEATAILAGAAPEEQGTISEHARQISLYLGIEDKSLCTLSASTRYSSEAQRRAVEALERALEILKGLRRDMAELGALARFVCRAGVESHEQAASAAT